MCIILDEIDYAVIGIQTLVEHILTEAEVIKMYVTSSNINSIWFEETTQYGIGVLSIEFHSGAVYEYYKFPTALFDRFVRAPSFGRFMWKYIRGKFPYRRVNPVKNTIVRSEFDELKDRIMATRFWKNGIKHDSWLYFDANQIVNEYLIVNIKLDRKVSPTDIARKTVNQLSNTKFGYKIRDGMIATNNTHGNTNSSRLYMLLPLDDNFKIFYNPNVADFNKEYADNINNSIDPYNIASKYMDGVKDIKQLPKIVTKREFMVYGNWILLNMGIFKDMVDGKKQ